MKGKSLDICPETNKGQPGTNPGIFGEFRPSSPHIHLTETPESSEHAFSLSRTQPEILIPEISPARIPRKTILTRRCQQTVGTDSPYRLAVIIPIEALPMQSQSTQKAPAAPDPDLQLYIEADFAELSDFSDALPASLIDAFASSTGWELAQVGDEIKIVDMSAAWPAGTPTVHRGKCDLVAEELSRLLGR